LTKWYEEHGRHEIFAGGKKVKMDDETHSLLLRENIVTTELQHDLDKLGIAKNAREEKCGRGMRNRRLRPSFRLWQVDALGDSGRGEASWAAEE
jgi:hypothetical protein